VLILEEAAYCDEGFFYETVAPILSIGSASLVAISTLTSEINFYTRLIKMVDPATDRPLFATRCIELCCEKCKEDGKSHECVHMLHLVPSWQSAERHRKLKIMMQDRPDLIQSELAGLAFDSLQQVFRKQDLILMFDTTALTLALDPTVWIVIDPAAGGPQSDYALVSICRIKGCVVVRVPRPCSRSYAASSMRLSFKWLSFEGATVLLATVHTRLVSPMSSSMQICRLSFLPVQGHCTHRRDTAQRRSNAHSRRVALSASPSVVSHIVGDSALL